MTAADALRGNMSDEPQQVPSIGRIVHFVVGFEHHAAIITDPAFEDYGVDGNDDVRIMQSLTVFSPNEHPYFTAAIQDEDTKNAATWHFPEYVPAR